MNNNINRAIAVAITAVLNLAIAFPAFGFEPPSDQGGVPSGTMGGGSRSGDKCTTDRPGSRDRCDVKVMDDRGSGR